MDAFEFYDTKQETHRTSNERMGVKNAHNFIKAVLIQRFVPHKSRILDLGCGQGGDLTKLKHSKPSIYVGMDHSPKAISAAQGRCSNLNMRCRCHFLCADFTTSDWSGYPPYDVVNCQFAIHFAFETLEKANFTMKRIAKYLVDGGCFLGTMPKHTGCSTSEEVVVRLPGDERECKEYAVQVEDLTRVCTAHGLHLIFMQTFDAFFEHAKEQYPDLMLKMRVEHPPEKDNLVFCFQK